MEVTAMRKSSEPTSQAAAVSVHHPDDVCVDGSTASGAIGFAERSCCCSAPPVVRVVFMPAGSVHPVDLLMCGHHYRQSAEKLAAMSAMVLDHDGCLLPPPALGSDPMLVTAS
jgi:hypothetical protein